MTNGQTNICLTKVEPNQSYSERQFYYSYKCGLFGFRFYKAQIINQMKHNHIEDVLALLFSYI